MKAKEKCPGLLAQSQGHKDKFTAISLAKTGGKVNGKLEPIEAHEKSAAGGSSSPAALLEQKTNGHAKSSKNTPETAFNELVMGIIKRTERKKGENKKCCTAAKIMNISLMYRKR